MQYNPSFLYHATEAPAGRKFTDDAEYDIALSLGWVDTPAKFSVVPEPAAVLEPEPEPALEPPTKRKKEKA